MQYTQNRKRGEDICRKKQPSLPYHKGSVVFDPWNDVDGNAVDDPFSFYGKDKMDEFCRRILAKKEVSTPSRMISVDSKILDFLKMLYFGVTDNPFEAASRSA